MSLRLLQRRTVWCPTWLGLFCIFALVFFPAVWWWNSGESFLSLTRRLPAEVLVVEGWIGHDGIRAAAAEFEQHGYRYVVTSGGLSSERSGTPRWSYAEDAEHELVLCGIPKDRIIIARSKDVESQRTYESAEAVRWALQAKGSEPRALNVFSCGPHARRSWLVFAKVFRPGTNVGVISWIPDSSTGAWWHSSERARDLLTETVGYLYEALLNSGRGFQLSIVPRLNK